MAEILAETTEPVYPWENLWPKDVTVKLDALPGEDVQNLEVELEAANARAQALETRLAEMRSISSATFDKMNAKIEGLTKDLAAAKASKWQELHYPIIVQAIINHKKGLRGEKKFQKTLDNVVVWLKQRANVIKYLSNHRFDPAELQNLAQVLHVDDPTLTELVRRLAV